MANTPALTTIFTPPASCLSHIFLETVSSDVAIVLGNYRDTASCLPSGIDPLRTSYFSPGLACPSGYTEACSSIVSAGTAQETRATCCPVGGFTCKGVDATYWPFDSSYGCQWYFPTTTVETVTTSSAGAYYTTKHTMRGDYDYMNAFSVQLRYQSTDLTPATSSASATSSSAASSGSATSSSTSAPSKLGGGGLSTGATLGIALGVGIPAAAILGALLVFAIMRWRKKRDAQPGWNHATGATPYEQSNMNQYQYSGLAHGDPKYGSPPPPQELEGRGYASEMSGAPQSPK